MSGLMAIPASMVSCCGSLPTSRRRRGRPVLSAAPVIAACRDRAAGAGRSFLVSSRAVVSTLRHPRCRSGPISRSLMAFSYNGVHADALKHGRNWNVKPSWPPLVLWWVTEHRVPDWPDGAERLEYLHDHGASPRAFTFKQPFAADGQAYAIDRDKSPAARGGEQQGAGRSAGACADVEGLAWQRAGDDWLLVCLAKVIAGSNISYHSSLETS